MVRHFCLIYNFLAFRHFEGKGADDFSCSVTTYATGFCFRTSSRQVTASSFCTCESWTIPVGLVYFRRYCHQFTKRNPRICARLIEDQMEMTCGSLRKANIWSPGLLNPDDWTFLNQFPSFRRLPSFKERLAPAEFGSSAGAKAHS
jgi:hypothetical protein